MHASKFVESYFDAWNHADAEAVAEHLAPQGIYVDVPENLSHGPSDLVVTLRDFFRDNRAHYELIGEILVGADSIAFQYQVSHDTGEHVEWLAGAEFITLDGNAAARITDYYEVPGAERPPQLRAAMPGGRKYAKSGLDPERMRQYQQRLKRAMQRERIYLQPDLTLPMLAKHIDCSVNHLSQVINAGFGQSFFDYVNRYRIRRARRLLEDMDRRRDAILDIAYAVGFNSNSAFYSAFRKHVGKTPAQYRRERGKRR